MEDEQTRKKKTNSTTYWIFLIGGLIVAFLWLMTATNLPELFKISDIPTFQKNIFNLTLLVTIGYLLAVIFQFYFRDKFDSWKTTEKNTVILVDSHTQLDNIRTIAKQHYRLQLGKCIKTSPLMTYKEASAIPVTRFYLFENLKYNRVDSYSLWKVDFVRKITTHLMYADFYGRNNYSKHWHGELREEEYRGIADTTASKKEKDIKASTPEEQTQGSATDEEE